MSTQRDLEQCIISLFDSGDFVRSAQNLTLLAEFRAALNAGLIRVAEPSNEGWRLNIWVKKGLLLHVFLGEVSERATDSYSRSIELDTMPPRQFTKEDGVRMPGISSYVRDGAFVGPRVLAMPSVFINMGAYVGSETVLDSHVSVGLCAQIGSRVQISVGSHIGGYLNPLDQMPTVISDGAMIGGNCGIYDGYHVGDDAIIGAGTTITSKMPLYDVKRKNYILPQDGRSVIPKMAVVLSGSCAIARSFDVGMSVQMPIIVGYRGDPKIEEDVFSSLLDH